MEKCGLLESPSFITFSNDHSLSDDDSYNLYREMQRIPYVLLPRNIVNSKRIFERVNNVAKGSTLEEYLKKIKHPIVTRTPVNDASPTNPNSFLKLTPNPIRRNSIISGRFIGYKKRLSRKSLNDSVKKSKNKNRHSISDENSYQNDLNGIEPLNQTPNLIANELIAEQETQTTDSLNKSRVKLRNVQKETEILCDGTNKQIPKNSASKIQEKFTFNENLANSSLEDLDNVILISSMENTLQNKSIQNEKSVVDNFNSNYNIDSNILQVSVGILRSTSRLLNVASDVSNRNETFTAPTKSNNRYKKIYKEETVNVDKDTSDLTNNSTTRKKSKNVEISPVSVLDSIKEDDENKNKKKRQVRRTKITIKGNETPDQRELTRTDKGKKSQSTDDLSGLQANCFANTMNLQFAKPSSPIKTNKNASQSKETIEEIRKKNAGIVVGKKTNSLNLPKQSSCKVHEVVEIMTPNEDDNANTKKYKRKTNLKGTNKTNNNAAQNSIPIELQKYIVSQSGGCDSRSVEPDNEGTFRADPRLRRTIKPRVPYIQAIFISPKRKRSIAKNKKSNKRTSKASNHNTTKTKNLEDLVETEVAASTNSESNKEECFKKPKGRAMRKPKVRADTSNLQTTFISTIHEPNDTYLRLSLVSDEAVDNIDNQDKTLTRDDSTYNSIESKSTRIPAGKNKSRVQNVSTEQRFSKTIYSNDGTLERLNPEAKRKKVIEAVVNNSLVMLEWYSDIPSVGDTPSVNVLYSLTNLRSDINNVSCGFVIIGPSQEESQIPSNHVILFKIEKGRALVSQQLISVEMNPEQSFYVPLGSAYRIKNLSDSETLVLYFAKMAK